MPEIEYAFLADAAEALPGQKFSVLGGGVSRLAGPAVPFTHPHLSLVVGLRLTARERDREHELSFLITAPDGTSVAESNGRVVAHGPAETEDVILTLAIDLWNLTLSSAGEYAVRIMIGGSERKRLPLLVTLNVPPQPEQRYLA
jgi:hypothetical protein